MAGFGDNLRREREMRGITLAEISDSTKISIRLLEALENNDLSKLPGGIFTRSFIRGYASYLGLDPERVMAEYQLAAPPAGEEDFSRIGANNSKASGKFRAPILAWVIALALLAGGYAIFRYAHRSSETSLSFGSPAAGSGMPLSTSAGRATPVPSALNPASAIALHPAATISGDPQPSTATPGQARPGSKAAPAIASNPDALRSAPVRPVSAKAGLDPQLAAGTRIASSTSPQPTGPSLQGAPGPPLSSTVLEQAREEGKMVLRVEATQPVWVAVDADGKTVLEHVLTANESRTLVAKDYFDVTTGNAQGTVLTLDGATLKTGGQHGEVKKIHLTRDDLKTYSP